jgi:hypothetical protein
MTVLSNIVMPLINSFKNLMRFLPIIVLILQIPAQALETAMVRAPLQEVKEMEEVILLFVPFVVSAVAIQEDLRPVNTGLTQYNNYLPHAQYDALSPEQQAQLHNFHQRTVNSTSVTATSTPAATHE